ncbi:TetR/AcrR family transcriptional regulator [Cohnella candidum]|uniref:TetR/AcrR family transcriptional regulator n=1 Tax=Cohnella candidum TaxID=2674991 RepID=A0A3G3K1N6_9BACL|nr:TetR/AcrR family transcriptional regulator [Cohnella candidum]AYQ74378.1 TetR/AcrR family transcriptional regulator [Cohnella candidum]
MDDELGESLPRGVALSWGLVKPPQRGPKREMSVEKIVDAAIAIADKEGLSALSMSRVAEALGFTTMSLYRYVPSKDDLLLLMQNAASKLEIPPDEDDTDWRQKIRVYVRASIQAFRDHPWFGDIPVTGVPLMPNNLQIVDWALRALDGLPLNDFEKMSTVLLVSSYARSVGIIQRDFDRAIQAGASPGSFTGLDYTNALRQLVTPDRFPNLHPLVASGVYTEESPQENPVGDDFDWGLERILDGIEAYLTAKKTK